jgi:FkbM family methyltransferase
MFLMNFESRIVTTELQVTRRPLLERVSRFATTPWREKIVRLASRSLRTFPSIPLPIRLPWRDWWLAQNDYCSHAILKGCFENEEWRFVERFLQPGMTVLDIGAHHGYYTLLASRKAGPKGYVIAFEPSPRERRRLHLHIRLNGCRNVETEDCALGETEGTAQLHLVLGTDSGCNSLRKPAVTGQTELIPVRIERLDRVLQQRRIGKVDFIKLDVEGAELSVLKGATELLHRRPRPVIFAEVQDIRTEPWGYPAKRIVRYLCDLDYRLFQVFPGENLEEIDMEQEKYDGNFVAIPDEQVESLQNVISKKTETFTSRARGSRLKP